MGAFAEDAELHYRINHPEAQDLEAMAEDCIVLIASIVAVLGGVGTILWRSRRSRRVRMRG